MVMAKNKILVVDDDRHICELVKLYLDDEFDVDIAYDGAGGLRKIRESSPDLLILDLMLPKVNGLEVCRETRERFNLPIIMLTAKGEETDKILGLELGADDYITKPFSPRELAARVKAVMRRVRQPLAEPVSDNENILRYQGLYLNADKHRAEVNGETVDLTPKEFEILWHMAKNHGRVFTREQLLEQVWGWDFEGDARAVDSHIKRLRKKLEGVAGAESYIHTVWGLGYKFEVQES